MKMNYAGTVNALIRTEHIKRFGAIWQFCPMSALSEGTTLTAARVKEIKANPTKLKKLEMRSIAKFFMVPQETIEQLVQEEKSPR